MSNVFTPETIQEAQHNLLLATGHISPPGILTWASEFTFIVREYRDEEGNPTEVNSVEIKQAQPGMDRWKITWRNGNGAWHSQMKDFVYERLPSNRTEKDYEFTRFTFVDATLHLREAIAHVEEWCELPLAYARGF